MEEDTHINSRGANDSGDEKFNFGDKRMMPFSVPANYFESLESSIINRIEAMEELEEYKVLSSVNKETPFNVPLNYFEKAEDALEYSLELDELKVLSSIAKLQLQPLSEEFTTAFESELVYKVELADELKEYKTLYALDKENNFAVPTDYFEDVTNTIKEAVHLSAKRPHSIIETILVYILKPRMAATFGIVLLLGISSVYYFNQGTVIADTRCKTLACLEKNELLNEKNIRDFDDDNLIDAVDMDKLNEQLGKAMAADSTNTNTTKGE